MKSGPSQIITPRPFFSGLLWAVDVFACWQSGGLRRGCLGNLMARDRAFMVAPRSTKISFKVLVTQKDEVRAERV